MQEEDINGYTITYTGLPKQFIKKVEFQLSSRSNSPLGILSWLIRIKTIWKEYTVQPNCKNSLQRLIKLYLKLVSPAQILRDLNSILILNSILRRDHQKKSYERRAYESVDEKSLS